MQLHQRFSRPHSPWVARQSILQEGLRTFEQSKNEQDWVKNWIERKQRTSPAKPSLCDYREQLIHHARLLEQYQCALQTGDETLLGSLKDHIEQSSRSIYDADRITAIQRIIRQRKSKRRRLRRRREEPSPIVQSAPCGKTLAEKIQDIDALLQKIEQIQRLGLVLSDPTNEELTDIQRLCTEKRREYQTSTARTSQIDLHNYLFNNQGQSFYESSLSDAHYFLRAHQSKNQLLHTRHAWDRYLSGGTSDRMPSAWHEPQAPSDPHWARYIFSRDESMTLFGKASTQE